MAQEAQFNYNFINATITYNLKGNLSNKKTNYEAQRKDIVELGFKVIFRHYICLM
jgi:hypothetical protein